MNKLIVLSGVNMVEGGILTVFRMMIETFHKIPNVRLICLVHDISLFKEFSALDHIEFYEYKNVKSSWFGRLKFEFFTSYALSKKINADAWVCLHDISARVVTDHQFVYCHNPAPFYKSSFIDIKYDLKFFLFTKFYKYLYRINIKSNKYVIVQQEWIAKYFKKSYGINNLLVARPVVDSNNQMINTRCKPLTTKTKKIIYPAFPRTFKNFRIILDAMGYLKKHESQVYNTLNILLTFEKNMTKFGNKIIEECERREINNIHFIGLQSKKRLDDLYFNEADALIFPSKLETWGLPLSEAKYFNLPIMAADVPYAHETIGKYDKVVFFRPDSPQELAEQLVSFSQDKNIFHPTNFTNDSACVVSPSWSALVEKILNTLREK